jgi:hypothetical protein
LFLLDDLGHIYRIPILTLIGERRSASGGGARLSLASLGAQHVWTPPEGVDVDELRLASPMHKQARAGDSVIVFSPTLEQASVVTVVSTAVTRRPLEITLSPAFRSGLDLAAGLPAEDDAIALVDVRGSRIFTLDPFRNKPALHVLAGNGSTAATSAIPYGAAQGTSLHPMTSGCRFGLSATEVQELADLLTISPERKLSGKVTQKLTSSEERQRRCVELLQKLDFYVVFDEASKVVSSISSSTSQQMLARMTAAPGLRFQPLSPPASRANAVSGKAGHPLSSLRTRLQEARRVCVGPDSSLLFWSPGRPECIQLNSVTRQIRALRRDDEFMKELASRTKLRLVFDSTSL